MIYIYSAGLTCVMIFSLAFVNKGTESTPKDTALSPIDTSIIFYDETDKPLLYHQYVKLIRTGKYSFRMNNGKKTVGKIPDEILKYVNADSITLNNHIRSWMIMADKIIVQKAKRKLYLERNGKVIFEFPVQLGKNPVDPKQKEGDGRTPEGLYYIDYNVNRDPSYYRGFHISYPNAKDKLNAKNLGIKPGGDIMIHGTGPTRANLKDWTNGCIAISNAHIDTLSKYISNGVAIEIKK